MKLTKVQESKRKSDHVQSVLIPKYYGRENVKYLIDKLGFNYFYVDETKNYFRVRQFNPDSFSDEKVNYITVHDKKYKDILYVIVV